MPEEKNGTPEQDFLENETAGVPDTEASADGEAPDGSAVPGVEETAGGLGAPLPQHLHVAPAVELGEQLGQGQLPALAG